MEKPMATSKPAAVKKLKLSRASMQEEKYTGPEPEWPEDTSTMTEFDINYKLTRALNYYNYHYTPKEVKKLLVDWAYKNNNIPKEKVKEFEKSSDRFLSMTPCGLIAAHYNGMPLSEYHVNYLISSIDNTIRLQRAATEKTEADEPKKEVWRPTIQEVMAEKTSEIIGDFEGYFDNVIDGRTSFKFYEFLQNNKVPQQQLGKYQEVIDRKLQEFSTVQSKKDDQLTEAYKFLKAADIKRIIQFLEECNTALEQYREVKRATKKLRVKKAPSKEKLIAKLNFKKEDQELKLVSVPPTSILTASTLWVYNTKTRKLGKYVADAMSKTLSVKGSTIVGFDEAVSVCKTLRKPTEQLAEFNKATKVKLRKFLEDIRATETKMTGRINSDIILLRAD